MRRGAFLPRIDWVAEGEWRRYETTFIMGDEQWTMVDIFLGRLCLHFPWRDK